MSQCISLELIFSLYFGKYSPYLTMLHQIKAVDFEEFYVL